MCWCCFSQLTRSAQQQVEKEQRSKLGLVQPKAMVTQVFCDFKSLIVIIMLHWYQKQTRPC